MTHVYDVGRCTCNSSSRHSVASAPFGRPADAWEAVVVQSGRADHVVWHNERPRPGIGASHAWLHSRPHAAVARVLLQRGLRLRGKGTCACLLQQQEAEAECSRRTLLCRHVTCANQPTVARREDVSGLFARTCCSFNLATTYMFVRCYASSGT